MFAHFCPLDGSGRPPPPGERPGTGWRSRRGIATIDQLSAEAASAYVIYLRDRGAAPATLRKVKTLLSSLAAFCAETPGYEAGLCGDQLASLRLPPLVERIPQALLEDECLRLIAACSDSLRDRVIVETFLLTGVRVSELCAPMFHLQDALGHRSLDMVRRYYSQNRHAQAEGFYRAFRSG